MSFLAALGMTRWAHEDDAVSSVVLPFAFCDLPFDFFFANPQFRTLIFPAN
jgi:hypothetical protein